MLGLEQVCTGMRGLKQVQEVVSAAPRVRRKGCGREVAREEVLAPTPAGQVRRAESCARRCGRSAAPGRGKNAGGCLERCVDLRRYLREAR